MKKSSLFLLECYKHFIAHVKKITQINTNILYKKFSLSPIIEIKRIFTSKTS